MTAVTIRDTYLDLAKKVTETTFTNILIIKLCEHLTSNKSNKLHISIYIIKTHLYQNVAKLLAPERCVATVACSTIIYIFTVKNHLLAKL